MEHLLQGIVYDVDPRDRGITIVGLLHNNEFAIPNRFYAIMRWPTSLCVQYGI